MQSGNHIVERACINGTVGEGTWTVVEHVPLKKVVLTLSGTPLGNLRIAYGFEEDRREVRFTRSLIMDLTTVAKNFTDQSLEEQ